MKAGTPAKAVLEEGAVEAGPRVVPAAALAEP